PLNGSPLLRPSKLFRRPPRSSLGDSFCFGLPATANPVLPDPANRLFLFQWLLSCFSSLSSALLSSLAFHPKYHVQPVTVCIRWCFHWCSRSFDLSFRECVRCSFLEKHGTVRRDQFYIPLHLSKHTKA